MCDKHSALYPALQLTVVFCLYCRLTTRFLTMALGCHFISFEHGGQDTKFWDGWFGVRVTGSSVTIEV